MHQNVEDPILKALAQELIAFRSTAPSNGMHVGVTNKMGSSATGSSLALKNPRRECDRENTQGAKSFTAKQPGRKRRIADFERTRFSRMKKSKDCGHDSASKPDGPVMSTNVPLLGANKPAVATLRLNKNRPPSNWTSSKALGATSTTSQLPKRRHKLLYSSNSEAYIVNPRLYNEDIGCYPVKIRQQQLYEISLLFLAESDERP